MSTIDEDLAQAKAGNMEPLLARLRDENGPAPGLVFEDHIGDPGSPPDGDAGEWFDILAAHMDGELTDEQMLQCEDAVGADTTASTASPEGPTQN